jgi:CHAD domain-containing protein
LDMLVISPNMTLLQNRIRALSTDLKKSASRLQQDVSVKDVHRLRTTIRRMESLIGFTHPEVGRKQQKAVDELNCLRKRAGKVRDLDIQMGLLGAIGNGSTTADRRAMTDFLKARRNRQAVRLLSEVRDLDHHKFFLRMEKIGEKVGEAAAEGEEPSPLDQARNALQQMAGRAPARQALKAARLHEMRISLRSIRYTAELAEDSEAKQELLDELRPVHDAIGEWHDWETLLATAEKQFKGRVNCPLLVEMRALLSAKFSSAVSSVHRLFVKIASSGNRKPTTPEVAPDLARPA